MFSSVNQILPWQQHASNVLAAFWMRKQLWSDWSQHLLQQRPPHSRSRFSALRLFAPSSCLFSPLRTGSGAPQGPALAPPHFVGEVQGQVSSCVPGEGLLTFGVLSMSFRVQPVPLTDDTMLFVVAEMKNRSVLCVCISLTDDRN